MANWYNEATVSEEAGQEPVQPYEASKAGVALVREFEGFSREAYPDPATGGDPWTIGYGTTRVNGRAVRPGMTTTHQQAESWLQADLRAFERSLNDLVRVPVNQNQYDALLSLTYNIGPPNFGSSTLLRKLNRQQYRQAAKEFPRWRMANGRVMAGLERRRAAEKALFEEPV